MVGYHISQGYTNLDVEVACIAGVHPFHCVRDLGHQGHNVRVEIYTVEQTCLTMTCRIMNHFVSYSLFIIIHSFLSATFNHVFLLNMSQVRKLSGQSVTRISQKNSSTSDPED